MTKADWLRSDLKLTLTKTLQAHNEALLAELEEGVKTLIDQNDDGMWAGRETAEHILSLISSKRMK